MGEPLEYVGLRVGRGVGTFVGEAVGFGVGAPNVYVGSSVGDSVA